LAKAGFPENIQENYRRHIKWDVIVTKAGGFRNPYTKALKENS